MNSDENNLNPPPPHQPDGLEMMCAGIVATEFGRRESNALANAVAQLAAEESVELNWLQKIYAGWLMLRPFPKIAFTGVFILVVGFSALMLYANRKSTIGSAGGELRAHWAADSKNFGTGAALRAGEFQLASGVVELTFNSKARVAIEGPAQFRLGDNNSIELRAGKLSADVPPPAHGFAVKTPNATIVDLGTRFGVNVGSDSSRVDVFQGKVTLTPLTGASQTLTQTAARIVNASGAVTRTEFSETFYPGVSITRIVHPANCGFDGPARTLTGGVPSEFGFWSGPAYELVGSADGISPVEGAGMLHFKSPGAGKNSEVWQLMDLRPLQAMIRRGGAQIKTSAFFNRVAGGADSAKKFGLTVAAFSGAPKNVEQLWAQRNELALALTDKELVSDDNPKTWEKLEVLTALPTNADFLIIQMRAMAPDNSNSPDPFPGHFADLIDCAFSTPLQPGTSN